MWWNVCRFVCAKISNKTHTNTFSYRILPHSTDSYRNLPHFTDWGVVSRRLDGKRTIKERISAILFRVSGCRPPFFWKIAVEWLHSEFFVYLCTCRQRETMSAINWESAFSLYSCMVKLDTSQYILKEFWEDECSCWIVFIHMIHPAVEQFTEPLFFYYRESSPTKKIGLSWMAPLSCIV